MPKLSHKQPGINDSFEMRPLVTLWLLLITLSGSRQSSAAAAPVHVQTLVPFDFLNGQLIDLDTGVNVYRLDQLKPSTSYEVRTSFPASVSRDRSTTIQHPPAF